MARAAGFGAIALAFVLLLWAVRDVLTPFFVAVVLAYILRPVVSRLTRSSGLPRPLVVLTVFAGLLLLLATIVVLLVPSIAREMRGLTSALPRLILNLRRMLEVRESVVILGMTVDPNPITEEMTRSLVGTLSSTSRHVLEGVVATVETLLKTVLSFVIAFYLLVDTARFRRTMGRLLPPRMRGELGTVLNEMDHLLGQFLLAELVLVVIMTAVTWVALTVLGIRYALVLAIIAGFLELIPFVGPIAAAVPAVLLAFVIPSPHGWPPAANAAAVAATYFVLRHAEDYFVIPHVVGRAVQLHPLMAMFAAFAGLRLGGILGMFLGVPLAAVAKVLLVYLYHKLVPTWEEPAIGSTGAAEAAETAAAAREEQAASEYSLPDRETSGAPGAPPKSVESGAVGAGRPALPPLPTLPTRPA
jgi:predicted PurR-regulated permease PerM